MSEIGLIPPQDILTEEMVLGQLMIDAYAFDNVVGKINKNMFYKSSNKDIFIAIEDLYKSNTEIDIVSVVHKLGSNGTLDSSGGPVRISELSIKVSSAANIETHVDILMESYMRREVISVCQRTLSKAYDRSNSLKDILDKFQGEVVDIGSELSTRKESQVGDALEEVLNEASDTSTPKTYVDTHIGRVQEYMNGFGSSQLIILAARPAHGKSSLMLDIAKRHACNGYPAAIFSLEMSVNQIVTRIATSETGISINKINNKELTSDEFCRFEKVVEKYRNIPLYMDDTPAINYVELKAKIRRLIHQKGIKAAYVDYLQLMSGKKELQYNKTAYVGDISNNLKQIAMDLDIPIIALSQLSRAIENRPIDQQTPKLSDLRDTGEIEQDADVVMFLTNPDKINMKQFEGESTEGRAILEIAKNRHGETASFFIGKSKNSMEWGDSVGNTELPF